VIQYIWGFSTNIQNILHLLIIWLPSLCPDIESVQARCFAVQQCNYHHHQKFIIIIVVVVSVTDRAPCTQISCLYVSRPMFYTTGVIADRSFTFSTFCSCDLDLDKIFDLLCSCDLNLNLMTFIYKLEWYSLEVYRMCKYELPTLRLLKVIVWQTDRQTDRHDRNYIPRRFAGGQ